jgi:hypothetical protein
LPKQRDYGYNQKWNIKHRMRIYHFPGVSVDNQVGNTPPKYNYRNEVKNIPASPVPETSNEKSAIAHNGKCTNGW